MIPTCISDDRAAAAAVNRRTLTGYLQLPNYRNYWRDAGYVEEMAAVEKALAAGERDGSAADDRPLARRRDALRQGGRGARGPRGLVDAGLRTPILVPSSAAGNQMKAFEELFAAF